MEGEGFGVCHATDRPRSGDPLLHAGPGRLPHRGRPVHRPAARQARRKAPGGPPWLNSVTTYSPKLMLPERSFYVLQHSERYQSNAARALLKMIAGRRRRGKLLKAAGSEYRETKIST